MLVGLTHYPQTCEKCKQVGQMHTHDSIALSSAPVECRQCGHRQPEAARPPLQVAKAA